MIVNIEEPIKVTREDVVGIDFGTTNSLVAFFIDGKVQIISEENGKSLVPSVVAYENGNVVVGDNAKNFKNAVFSIKRLLGKNLQSCGKDYPFLKVSDKDNISLNIGGDNINIIKIASDIFVKLKNRAEKFLSKKVNRAVITVPAYFDNSSRNAVKNAAKLAGIDTLRLLSEPTAAALFYGVDKGKDSGTYVVYDLGGGTFDVSVLSLHKGVFKVLSIGGDDLLGGDDFDKLLADYIAKRDGLEILTETDHRNLINLAKEIKESLSTNTEAKFHLDLDNKQYGKHEGKHDISVNVSEFNDVISALLDKTIERVKSTLNASNKSVEDIERVLLVGGSTRIGLITEKLTEIFGREKIFTDLDPDTIVAKGAALYASFLSGANPDRKLLLDVLPLSLGIETMGGAVEKIILKDSRIPISQTQMFTNYIDGQTSFKINVVQGEREFAKDSRSLAEFILSNIPPLPAGKARIEVTFTVNEDGILVVSAKEKTHNIIQKVAINPTYGLSQDTIEKMIEDSFKNAKSDIEAKQLLDAKTYGQKVLKIIENAIKSHTDLLKDGEENVINHHLDNLRDLIKSNDHAKINKAADDLEKAASSFLQRRLEFLLQGIDLKI